MQKIDISNSTIIRFFLILMGIFFLYFIRDILVLLFLVLIIVAALSPTIDKWGKYLTRTGAVVLVFLIIFLAFAVAISIIVPPLVSQIHEFSTNLPSLADVFSAANTHFSQGVINIVRDNLSQVSSQLSNIGGTLLSKTFGLVSGLVAAVTVIVLSFYLLIEEEGMKKIYRGIIPAHWHNDLTDTTRKIAVKLGAWMRGQILLMLIVGVADAILLYFIRVPYSLTLGTWAALTEVVPIVGPFIGAIPGIAVALSASPLQGFLALLIYLVVQQAENNFLVPKIMAKAVGLNPVIVIIAILIGDKLYGLLGILLSVPLAAAISVIAQDWPVISKTFRKRVN